MPEIRKLKDAPNRTEWQPSETPITNDALTISAFDWLEIGVAAAGGGPLAGAMVLAGKAWNVNSAIQGMQFLFYFSGTIRNFIEIWNQLVNDVQPGFQGEQAEKLVACLCRVATACGNPPEGVAVPPDALAPNLAEIAERLGLYQRDEQGNWVVDNEGNRVLIGETGQIVEEMQKWVKSQYYKYNESDDKPYSTVESVTKLLIDGYIRHNQS